jgi:hypothetical protein
MGAFRHQQQAGLAYDLLPPERKTVPRSRDRFERKSDIADAEFVTVLPVRGSGFSAKRSDLNHRYLQADPHSTSSRAMAATVIGLRLIERWLQRASARTFTALVAALFILVFGLAGGFSGLSGKPAVAASGPLQFSHITVTPRDANGMRIILVNGIIANAAGATVSVPPIRAELVSGGRLLSSVVVTPPADSIGAGQSLGFMARLQHPGGKMPEVRLSFMP